MNGLITGLFCWYEFINIGEITIYIGHLAIGIAAKTTMDKVPLWATIAAAYTNDILKVGFKAVGLEHGGSAHMDLLHGIVVITPADIPWSHGLLMSVVWSLLVAAIIYLIYRDRRSATIMGLVVISHWLLDFIVHPPELPLLFHGSQMVGLGLWMSSQGLMIANIMELMMLIGAIALYWVNKKRKKLGVSHLPG